MLVLVAWGGVLSHQWCRSVVVVAQLSSGGGGGVGMVVVVVVKAVAVGSRIRFRNSR